MKIISFKKIYILRPFVYTAEISDALLNENPDGGLTDTATRKKNLIEQLRLNATSVKTNKEILVNLREYFSRDTKKIPFFGEYVLIMLFEFP